MGVGTEKAKGERITFLVKYALVHPEVRDMESLARLAMATWLTDRKLSRTYAEIALARIAVKGDLYGLSPEFNGKPTSLDSKGKVHVVGAFMGDPAGLKALTPEEEKMILETPLEKILTMVERPKPPVTDFHIIEES